jgi:hypothetical protein
MKDKPEGPAEFKELAEEIRNLLKDNRRFLDRVMEEDFEPEDEENGSGDSMEDFEEL